MKENYQYLKKEAEKYKNKIERRKENRIQNEAPKRRVIEEIGNSITHGVGALIAIVLLILMIRNSNTQVKLVSGIIYGACMICQMAFSCMYHAFRYGTRVKRIFRRFDYSAIYPFNQFVDMIDKLLLLI